RVVEDVIYENISNFASEHLLHSFIIDVDDPMITGIFFPAEIDEIKSTNVKEEQELSNKLYENLTRYYDKKSVVEIKKIIREANLGCSNFEIETLAYSIYSLIRQYERNSSGFSLGHYENWYNVNIWGPVINRIYDDIPNIDIVRGESSSLASSDRKNHNCSEVGSHYEGQNATKWLNESGLKLPKMLRDMFVSLCKSVDWDLEKINNVETVGYIHRGSVLMIITLDFPAGYIHRLSKSDLYNILEDIESFNKALELITAVWKSKKQVVRTMELLQENEKDSSKCLKNVSIRKRSNRTNNQTSKPKKILPDN
ncbi:9360_t:CDS:2, partial [Funneliformis mosseae]